MTVHVYERKFSCKSITSNQSGISLSRTDLCQYSQLQNTMLVGPYKVNYISEMLTLETLYVNVEQMENITDSLKFSYSLAKYSIFHQHNTSV